MILKSLPSRKEKRKIISSMTAQKVMVERMSEMTPVDLGLNSSARIPF